MALEESIESKDAFYLVSPCKQKWVIKGSEDWMLDKWKMNMD